MRTLIVLVGTSLLTNRGWRRGQALPSQEEMVANLVRAGDAAAAAETHTLLQVPLRGPLMDRLAWLHSETPEGRLCADVLHAHYTHRGYESERRPVTRPEGCDAAGVEAGLQALVAETLAAIAAGPDKVAICAMGGFKADVAFLSVLGVLLGLDVHLLEGRCGTLITLPRVPREDNPSRPTDAMAALMWAGAVP